jgi:hypothetical protein
MLKAPVVPRTATLFNGRRSGETPNLAARKGAPTTTERFNDDIADMLVFA